MKRWFTLICILLLLVTKAQQIQGNVTDENGFALSSVLVFNMNTEKHSYTDGNGHFTIFAKVSDELRLVRNGFERKSVILVQNDFSNELSIQLNRTEEEIEEVNIQKLTGNIEKDAKALSKVDKVEQLQKEIGLPKPPEKPRETPSEVTKNILLPMAFGQLNVQAVYNVISGKARRQKSLYRYEDLQDTISWIRKRVDDDYFTKADIPQEEISTFIQFSIGQKPEITKYVKAGNLSKILLDLEETLPQYLSQ